MTQKGYFEEINDYFRWRFQMSNATSHKPFLNASLYKPVESLNKNFNSTFVLNVRYVVPKNVVVS